MSTLDKSEVTKGKLQYHLRVKPGDVARYVLLPGDPDRVLRIAKQLDDAKEVVFAREYRTVTGTYKGIPVSATSTTPPTLLPALWGRILKTKADHVCIHGISCG